MVYKGPSRGCEACRKRRVKCDEARPACGNCIKRKVPCPGYRNLFDAVHKSEVRLTTERVKASQEDRLYAPDEQRVVQYGSNYQPGPRRNPKNDLEMEALCFFFSYYVNVPRDPASNVYLEHFLPLYIDSAPESCLKLSTSAVALTIYDMWRQLGPDGAVARSFYARAIAALRQDLANPNEAGSDDVLGTIYMIDFYDSLKMRVTHEEVNDTHQKGAMALIRQRGVDDFQNDTSRRLFNVLRSRYVWYALQYRRSIDLDDPILCTKLLEDRPSAMLDMIAVSLANLLHDITPLQAAHLMTTTAASFLSNTTVHIPQDTDWDSITQRAINIDWRLQCWHSSLPPTWTPYRIVDPASIPASIYAIGGIYKNTCDVYSSSAASCQLNTYRTTRLVNLRLLLHALLCKTPSSQESTSDLNPLPITDYPDPYQINSQAQALVDQICASIPFHLGNRTDVALPDDMHEYPAVPAHLRALGQFFDSFGQVTSMTDRDHNRSTAATGGWFTLTPLMQVFKMCEELENDDENWSSWNTDAAGDGLVKFKLRSGQLTWIARQARRICEIYLIPIHPPL